MPSCFQLYPKGEKEPKILQHIDDEMRVHFEVPPDPDHWLGNWYDTIGFRLALGKSFEQIREQFKEYVEEERVKGNPTRGVEFYEALLSILDYLEERYSTNSFYSPFKD